jgi:negative regulator of sigma-B (phosphoserine phosphatase)
MRLQIASVTRPCHGFTASGDVAIVREGPDCTVLVVVDVLGHGPAAAELAARIDAWMHELPLDRAPDPAIVIERLHAELRGTRGAAATLCSFDGEILRSAGVGNVELRAIGVDPGLVIAPGVLGRRMRRVRAGHVALPPGTRIAIFSDGISGRLELAATRDLSPSRACEAIMQTYAKPNDDATILIFDVHAS